MNRISLRDTLNAREGITLLLVMVMLSAILAISAGIFNIIVGQILISGEIGDSVTAFYAADQGIDKTLYRDRMLDNCASPPCTVGPVSLSPRACYYVTYTGPGSVSIRAVGHYYCGLESPRAVRRGFEVNY